MKRNSKVLPAWLKFALACVLGVTIYLALSLLTANWILSEKLPEEFAQIALCVSAGIASFAAGLIGTGRGERRLLKGLLAGTVVALFVLLAKGLCSRDASWTMYTSIAVASCVICGALSSCIFHKSNRKATNKKRRKTHAK